MLYLLAAVLAG